MEFEIAKIRQEKLHIDEDFTMDLNKYQNKDILGFKALHVTGDILINSADLLEINLDVKGIMILKDSVTLEEIEYPFNSEIVEEYDLDDPFFQETYQKSQNILDILEILWENIVLEVPIRVTGTKDATLKGEGWSLGDNEINNEEIDPRLAKLNELLGKREE